MSTCIISQSTTTPATPVCSSFTAGHCSKGRNCPLKHPSYINFKPSKNQKKRERQNAAKRAQVTPIAPGSFEAWGPPPPDIIPGEEQWASEAVTFNATADFGPTPAEAKSTVNNVNPSTTKAEIALKPKVKKAAVLKVITNISVADLPSVKIKSGKKTPKTANAPKTPNLAKPKTPKTTLPKAPKTPRGPRNVVTAAPKPVTQAIALAPKVENIAPVQSSNVQAAQLGLGIQGIGQAQSVPLNVTPQVAAVVDDNSWDTYVPAPYPKAEDIWARLGEQGPWTPWMETFPVLVLTNAQAPPAPVEVTHPVRAPFNAQAYGLPSKFTTPAKGTPIKVAPPVEVSPQVAAPTYRQAASASLKVTAPVKFTPPVKVAPQVKATFAAIVTPPVKVAKVTAPVKVIPQVASVSDDDNSWDTYIPIGGVINYFPTIPRAVHEFTPTKRYRELKSYIDNGKLTYAMVAYGAPKESVDIALSNLRAAMVNPKKSLLGMPAEIRNQIFGYVFPGTDVTIREASSMGGRRYSGPTLRQTLVPACLQVNREFRSIALGYFRTCFRGRHLDQVTYFNFLDRLFINIATINALDSIIDGMSKDDRDSITHIALPARDCWDPADSRTMGTALARLPALKNIDLLVSNNKADAWYASDTFHGTHKLCQHRMDNAWYQHWRDAKRMDLANGATPVVRFDTIDEIAAYKYGIYGMENVAINRDHEDHVHRTKGYRHMWYGNGTRVIDWNSKGKKALGHDLPARLR